MNFLKSLRKEFKIIKFPNKCELRKTFKAVIVFGISYLILVSILDFLFQTIISKIIQI